MIGFGMIFHYMSGNNRKLTNTMTSFFEHQRSSFKRNYLRNLIVLASADGSLEVEEKELITRIGLRR